MPKCLTGQDKIHQVVHFERGLIISIVVKVALISLTVAVSVVWTEQIPEQNHWQGPDCDCTYPAVQLHWLFDDCFLCSSLSSTRDDVAFFLHYTIAVFSCHDDFTITLYIRSCLHAYNLAQRFCNIIAAILLLYLHPNTSNSALEAHWMNVCQPCWKARCEWSLPEAGKGAEPKTPSQESGLVHGGYFAMQGNKPCYTFTQLHTEHWYSKVIPSHSLSLPLSV